MNSHSESQIESPPSSKRPRAAARQPFDPERRAQIVRAALGVFAEKGFHAATIRDVARAAGLADGTIYNHFENKPALLLGILDLMTERARAQVDPPALAGLDLHGFVRAFLVQPLRMLEADNFGLFRVLIAEMMVNTPLRERFYAEFLEPMLRQGGLYFDHWAAQHPDQPMTHRPNLAVRTLSALMLGLMVQRILGDELLAADWDSLPDALADMLMSGLGGDLA